MKSVQMNYREKLTQLAFDYRSEEIGQSRIYISAFLNYAEFGRYCRLIAWDSHVWLAEIPEHMIHYNGDHYVAIHG